MKVSIQIIKCRVFKSDFDLSNPAFIRVHNKNVTDLGGRNSWIRLTNSDKSIYRMIRGKKPTTGFTTQCIEMDYDSIGELGLLDSKNNADEHRFYSCDILLCPVGFFGGILAHWHHPDNIYRVPLRISLVSLVIGVLGFAGGFIN